MITIVDYGMGNLGSIVNMFKRIGAESKIASDVNEISKAEKILLPGVGAFDAAMQRITDAGFYEVLNKKALHEKIPVLGICLGMQLLTASSEEGKLSGLGWVPATTKKFIFSENEKLKIPHMGWNTVKINHENALTAGLDDDARFYFVHSYYVITDDEKNSVLKTKYGIEFDSAIQKGNIFGAQFHPEKSHKFGMRFLENFAKI